MSKTRASGKPTGTSSTRYQSGALLTRAQVVRCRPKPSAGKKDCRPKPSAGKKESKGIHIVLHSRTGSFQQLIVLWMSKTRASGDPGRECGNHTKQGVREGNAAGVVDQSSNGAAVGCKLQAA